MIKAIRVKSIDSLEPLKYFRDRVSAFLLDAYAPDALGGTGLKFNWTLPLRLSSSPDHPCGGLTPENVQQAVRHVKPYGIDVSSGVERNKGRKDHQK